MLFPLLVLFFYSATIIVFFIAPALEQYDIILSFLSGIIIAITAYFLESKINKKKKEENIEIARRKEEDSIIKAKKAFNDRYYEYMLIELNNSLLNLLYRKLVEKIQIGRRAITNTDIVELSYKQDVINSGQKALLHEIRVLINNIAHGKLERPISRESAKELLRKAEQLLKTLN